MGYPLGPLTASILLGILFLVHPIPPLRTRLLVAGLVGAAAWVWLRHPTWLAQAMVVQSGVSIGVLLWLRWQGGGARRSG